MRSKSLCIKHIVSVVLDFNESENDAGRGALEFWGRVPGVPLLSQVSQSVPSLNSFSTTSLLRYLHNPEQETLISQEGQLL